MCAKQNVLNKMWQQIDHLEETIGLVIIVGDLSVPPSEGADTADVLGRISLKTLTKKYPLLKQTRHLAKRTTIWAIKHFIKNGSI